MSWYMSIGDWSNDIVVEPLIKWGWGRYLAGIGEAPRITVYVQHALFDLAGARLEARLVHLLLWVVHQRGVGGGGGRGGAVRCRGQAHAPQGHHQSDPLHPTASAFQLRSLGRRRGIGPLSHCQATGRCIHSDAHIRRIREDRQTGKENSF